MSSGPLVSVIIPTYNRADIIDRSISSVLDQSYKNIECIIVDDDSTDETEDIVSAFSDPRIRLVTHETNRGAPAARNTGMEAARGEYIAFLDSDDAWRSRKIEKQVEVFNQVDNTCGLVYTGYETAGKDVPQRTYRASHRGDIHRELLRRDVIGTTSTVMIRATCYENVGGFAEGRKGKQDHDLWIRISRKWTVDCVSEPLTIHYLDRNDRITQRYYERLEAYETLINDVEKDLHKYGVLYRRKARAEHYFAIGRYCQKEGQRADSLRYFLKALRMNPLKPKTLVASGCALFGINPDSDRVAKFRKIIN